MSEAIEEKQMRRRRIESMKKILLITALVLILISLILNIVLLFRVIHLSQLVEQLGMIQILMV